MIFKNKKKWNRKGEGSILLDYGATVFIVLVIVIFFFFLSIKSENAVYDVTGEQIGLDATQLALIYAQTPVETSLGEMTFAEFLVVAGEESIIEQEYVTATEKYFSETQPDSYVTIVIMSAVDEEEQWRVLVEPYLGFFETYRGPGWIVLALTSGGDVYSAPSLVRVPFHNPEMYGIIQVQTKINTE